MDKKDIKTREDVFLLVSSFYDAIRADEELGPFFNNLITDWEAHIEKLTTFWEASLFLKTKYKGDPLQAHIKVDQDNNHIINERHFGLWLNLWFKTIDDLFEGEYAQNAKHRARKMGTFLYMKIFEARQKEH
ncbi:group III truncated hemoglobin [Tamlana agarivorans]|uniref:Group III truncated hemoglobin n=1 Tax=Pseudotamlana agarivorans TaxID=481183 RepID=A0ACC5UBQ4_9FLAO|nr:group III truncated hemoglobin [Tamlana agarivorans]MBU2951729.1 group III truncated hemoglobin [Tamlana agarivorans]